VTGDVRDESRRTNEFYLSSKFWTTPQTRLEDQIYINKVFEEHSTREI